MRTTKVYGILAFFLFTMANFATAFEIRLIGQEGTTVKSISDKVSQFHKEDIDINLQQILNESLAKQGLTEEVIDSLPVVIRDNISAQKLSAYRLAEELLLATLNCLNKSKELENGYECSGSPAEELNKSLKAGKDRKDALDTLAGTDILNIFFDSHGVWEKGSFYVGISSGYASSNLFKMLSISKIFCKLGTLLSSENCSIEFYNK